MTLMRVLLLVGLILSYSNASQAQDAGDDSEIKSVESVLEKNMPKAKVQPDQSLMKLPPASKVNYDILRTNQPRQDQVIIQKTYQPKTQRWNVMAGASLVTNDVFYRTMGGQVRASYYFNETWGAEFTALYLFSSKSDITKEVANSPNLKAVDTLVTPRSYFGGDVYFNAIYGKIALNDRKIIPFEFYQEIGAGQMMTTGSQSSTAFHAGLGQIFAWTRDQAFRVDLSLYFFNAKNINGDKQYTNSLILTVGYGLFFPGARD
jgi:outer membrane beta-barrel protein